jgi:sulfatase modifying factor 1
MSDNDDFRTARPASSQLTAGTLLQQRYRLQRLLGKGGMGQAWLAEDAGRTVNGRPAEVVIKLLPELLRANADAHEDFRREYGKVWLLSHPHICKLFDMGEDRRVGCFQVMQYLPGSTLRQLLRERVDGSGLPRDQVLSILSACAQALDYAHGRRVLHRDVKPENVMYDPASGDVMLIDFGLAAEIRSSQSRYSRGQVDVSGTEAYMSPEQWQGHLQTAPCDQWALGIVAWELLTGRAPYQGSGMTLGFAVCQAPVPSLAAPWTALQPVFERVLRKAPDQRFGSCQEFVAELQSAFAAGTQGGARAGGTSAVPRPQPLQAPFSAVQAAAGQSAWARFCNCDVELQDRFGHQLRLIPPGEFTMGHNESLAALQNAGFVMPPTGDWEAQMKHEGPAHRVRITRPFLLGTGPVTRGQFAAFVRATGYRTEAESDGKGGWGYNPATQWGEQKPEFTWRQTGFDQTDAHPVVNVSWNDATAYIVWLNEQRQAGFVGRRFRLPTEAEWEYACRAGTTTRFFTGDTMASLQGFANVPDASFAKAFPHVDFQQWQKFEFDDGNAFTSVAGRYSSNPFGLYDMHGNVWDWCQDWSDDNYYGKSPAADPAGPASGSSRVLRGGSWYVGSADLRSADRDDFAPDGRLSLIGFRVVCELE